MARRVKADPPKRLVLNATTAKELMTVNPISIGADDTVKEADRKGVAPIDLNEKSPGMLAIAEIKRKLVEETNK